jgi:glycosyltransferase involved in cell wall biosynthesis
MAAPKVTVLLPVHNGEPYLAAAVQSVLGQSFADFELLIIDDGSTDRSCEIVRSFADPRIRLLRNAANQRLIATLNRGLEEARGEYVARMDADDISLPARLAAQVAFLDRNPGVGVLGSAVQLIDAQGTPGAVVRFPATHNLIRWALCFLSPIAHPAAMMRKAVVARLGGYRAQALHCEDYDLWWRASAVTQLANLDDVLLRLRKHDANITARHAALHGDTVLQVFRSMLSQALQVEFPLALIGAVREQAPATEAQIPQAIELLFRYYRFCLAAGAPAAAEEAAVRQDLTMRICRLLDDADRLTKQAPWRRLVLVGRYARLARIGFLTAAETRLVRNAAFRRGYQVLKDALRTGVRRDNARY